MFKAKIELDLFKEYIMNLMIVVEEININIDEKGISAKAVDVANVSMIASTIKREAFDNYELNVSQLKLGLDLLKIYDILSFSNKNCIINIAVDITTQKLTISFENLFYSTSLLDPSTIRDDPNIPNISFTNKCCIRGSDLKKSLKIAERVNDHIILELKDEKLYIISKNETDNINLVLESKILENVSSSVISSIYSIDYLLNLTKTIWKIDKIILSIGQDYPLLATFNLSKNSGSTIYFLAPRIESE